jgi:hypothetical protein
MFCSARQLGLLIVSSVLTVGVLTSAARAQVRSMNGGSMPAIRSSGMMGMMSTRGTFSGGFGLNAYGALGGMGRNSLTRYGTAGAGQSGYGGGGGQSQGGGATPSSNGGAGYNPSSSNATTNSQQAAEKDPLASVRLFRGGLNWPAALSYLTRDGDAKELRERIDAQVERMAALGTGESGKAELIQEVRGNVDKLQKEFEHELYDMPTSRQQNEDADRFLSKVKTALASYAKASTLSTGSK